MQPKYFRHCQQPYLDKTTTRKKPMNDKDSLWGFFKEKISEKLKQFGCDHLVSHKQSAGKEDQRVITLSVTSKVLAKRIRVPSLCQSQAKYWQRGSVCDHLDSHKQSTGKEDPCQSHCQSQAKYWQRGSLCHHLVSHKQRLTKRISVPSPCQSQAKTDKEDQCAITLSVTSKVLSKRIIRHISGTAEQQLRNEQAVLRKES